MGFFLSKLLVFVLIETIPGIGNRRSKANPSASKSQHRCAKCSDALNRCTRKGYGLHTRSRCSRSLCYMCCCKLPRCHNLCCSCLCCCTLGGRIFRPSDCCRCAFCHMCCCKVGCSCCLDCYCLCRCYTSRCNSSIRFSCHHRCGSVYLHEMSGERSRNRSRRFFRFKLNSYKVRF